PPPPPRARSPRPASHNLVPRQGPRAPPPPTKRPPPHDSPGASAFRGRKILPAIRRRECKPCLCQGRGHLSVGQQRQCHTRGRARHLACLQMCVIDVDDVERPRLAALQACNPVAEARLRLVRVHERPGALPPEDPPLTLP